MAWWGKLIGGTVGFMMGGPLGALLGSSIGHQFDARGRQKGSGKFLPGNQERTQAAFFTATFSVMGHLAKADGRVSAQEIQAASAVMNQMQLTPPQREAAMDLFEKGKKHDFPLDDILKQFRTECHRRVTLLRMFLEIQVQAALADGRIDPAENQILLHVANVLGFDSDQVDRLINFIRGVGNSPADQERALEDAYKVLGVDPETNDTDVKTAYRRLMSRHHPDKLVAKGLPEEMIKLATDKTKEIQKAWERIRDHRKV
jgi:DnaJ like chaperone protein